jgi:hypothetical protein
MSDRTRVIGGLYHTGTRMTWEPELEEIRRRTEMAKRMGGVERVQ